MHYRFDSIGRAVKLAYIPTVHESVFSYGFWKWCPVYANDIVITLKQVFHDG
jgi:hypothetical protein